MPGLEGPEPVTPAEGVLPPAPVEDLLTAGEQSDTAAVEGTVPEQSIDQTSKRVIIPEGLIDPATQASVAETMRVKEPVVNLEAQTRAYQGIIDSGEALEAASRDAVHAAETTNESRGVAQ